MNAWKLAAIALLGAFAAACGEETNASIDDETPLESEVDTIAQPVSCSPTIAVYPVRGRHNNGYDATAGHSAQWTCESDHSNSDFIAHRHVGNDIWAALGTPVVATQSGTITLTGWSDYSGNKVTIRDGCGWYHFFCHLNAIAPGIRNGVHVNAGQLIGYVGKTGTASNGVVHLHYSLYPDSNYDAGIDPWSRLHAAEHGTCAMPGSTPPSGGGSSPALSKHWVDTFAAATGYSAATTNSTANGRLNAGRNYVFCRRWGAEVRVGNAYNHWWMLTDLDTKYSGRSGRAYVSAYYLSHWGNDQAKDVNGADLPNCP